MKLYAFVTIVYFFAVRIQIRLNDGRYGKPPAWGIKDVTQLQPALQRWGAGELRIDEQRRTIYAADPVAAIVPAVINQRLLRVLFDSLFN